MAKFYLIMERLWTLNDITEERGEENDHDIEVKWANCSGQAEWVTLSENPELKG